MYQKIICNDDGEIYVSFFPTADALLDNLQEHYPAKPPVFLTVEEAAGDPCYWPERGVFVSRVTPLKAVPKIEITGWEIEES